ncbi:PLP-dependent aminotransferase family protein [Paraburkholderia sp.]|uniref:aminotransferase-like domain-containing protein n=1 Tax=Paraburkholderia sp. TaxID=1926495 RepID=UPI0039E28390
MIRLGGGLAFPGELPNIVEEAAAAAAMRSEGLQYGPLYGLDDLRDAVVDYLAHDGVTAGRDNILIVNGAKHGLDLACRVFIEPGDAIIVSGPTYMTALAIMKTHEVEFIVVAQDAQGMKVDELESMLDARRRRGAAPPKLLFDVPDFHNPTGITLSEARRRRIVELAVEYGFRILEDDPYRRVRFEGTPVAPIKTFDTGDYVIGLGTVSKILAPGLRIGWVNASPEIVGRMAAQKCDHGTNPFVQRIVAQLFMNGKVDEHIDRVKQTLRVHRDTMVAAVREHLPGSMVEVPQGGYFLWVRLPDDVDADALVRRAGELNVEVNPGGLSFAGPTPGQFIRLAYSFCNPEEIRTGIARLGEAYRSMRAAQHAA